jgi:hypothetical protein
VYFEPHCGILCTEEKYYVISERRIFMKAAKGLSIAGLVLGIVGSVVSVTGLVLSVFGFKGSRKA